MTSTNENEEEETEEMMVEQDPFDDLIHIHIHSHWLPLVIHEDIFGIPTTQLKKLRRRYWILHNRFKENGR
jgi:hypothetical protein